VVQSIKSVAMKGSKEFFEELRNGQEWLSCLMTKECYSGLEFEARERIAVTSVRQKNDLFTEDEEHKDLVKKVAKAKKELRNYEFDKNHGK